MRLKFDRLASSFVEIMSPSPKLQQAPFSRAHTTRWACIRRLKGPQLLHQHATCMVGQKSDVTQLMITTNPCMAYAPKPAKQVVNTTYWTMPCWFSRLPGPMCKNLLQTGTLPVQIVGRAA